MRLWLVLSLVVLVAAPTQSARAQKSTVAASPERVAHFAEVLRKTAAQERLPVIIRLAVPFVAEGRLQSQGAASLQRAAIADTQERVISLLVGPKGIKRFETIPHLALQATVADLQRLQSSSLVLDIEEDVAVPPSALPAGSFSSMLDQSTVVIGADNAWSQGITGEGWAVAILDTGVDSDHPFLDGKVVAEACYSTTSAGNSSTTVCPNNDETQTGAGAGAECSSSISGCFHGTHVAGIAAGSNTGSSGPDYGVARDADLIAIQVFSEFTGTICTNSGYSSPCVLTYSSDQILGLEYVFSLRNTYNIAAANMSLGGNHHTSTCDSDSRKSIIDNLITADIATVIASGNNGYSNATGSPACISTAVTVGSTTKSDGVSSFSNVAPHMDLFAPGSAIQSATPGTGYVTSNGTSMAAPHVAGAWALMREGFPTESVSELLTRLENTGVAISAGSPAADYPRIQVDEALGLGPPPLADALINPNVITALPYSGLASNASATSEGGESSASCASGNDGTESVWWELTPSSSGTLTVSTAGSDFDTVLSLWTATNSDGDYPLTQVDCNDDNGGTSQSEITPSVTAGTTYFVRVTGYAGATGTVELAASGPSVQAPSTSVAVTGSAGWRFLASPAEGATFDDLLGPIRTQGFPGADDESADVSVYRYVYPNSSSSADPDWAAPSNQSDAINSGEGVLAYVFNDDLGTTLSVSGAPPVAPHTYRDLRYTAPGDGWNLVGNPFRVALDWDDASWTKTNTENAIYVWDPNASGSGDYLSWNASTSSGTLGSGTIAPLQAFWVQTNADDPQLVAPEAALARSSSFVGREPSTAALNLNLDGTLDGHTATFSTAAIVAFHSEATSAVDAFDTHQLVPLTDSYLVLYAEASDGGETAALDLTALPRSFDTRLDVPLALEAAVAGAPTEATLTLSWPDLSLLPPEWSLTLKDQDTDATVNLRDTGAYTFSHVPAEGSTVQRGTPGRAPQRVVRSNESTRFLLTVEQSSATGQEPATTLPARFALESVFPNPARNYATARYTLPEPAEVTITVYDVLGRRIAQLVDAPTEAGRHSVRWNADGLASGLYIVRFEAGQTTDMHRVTLAR